MTQIRVGVIDGQRTFAEAVAARIAAEPGLDLVAVAQSTTAARRLLHGRHVDVVLLDSELTGSIDFAAELASTDAPNAPPIRVIMLGPVSGVTRAVEALRSGIAGWIPKEESVEQLLRIISGAMRDELWLPPTVLAPVLRLLLRNHDERNTVGKHPLGTLTPREREVLAYLAEGNGRRETAERMHLSTHTVRSHLQNLMGKLGVHTTLEAVAVARQAQATEARSGAPSAP
jgi:DNA-binding NarL/FixJ family response regulator